MAEPRPPRARAVRARHPRPTRARDRAGGGGRGRRAAARGRGARGLRRRARAGGRRGRRRPAERRGGRRRRRGRAAAARGGLPRARRHRARRRRPARRAQHRSARARTTCSSTCSSSGSRLRGRCAVGRWCWPRPGRVTPGRRPTAPTWRPGSNSVGAERCSLGFAAGPVPTVADAVTAARDAAGGAPVAVASYLLAPGFFQRRVEESGADVVTGADRAAPAARRDRAGALPRRARGVAGLGPARLSPSRAPAAARRWRRRRAR